jgi:hypothetical protein
MSPTYNLGRSCACCVSVDSTINGLCNAARVLGLGCAHPLIPQSTDCATLFCNSTYRGRTGGIHPQFCQFHNQRFYLLIALWPAPSSLSDLAVIQTHKLPIYWVILSLLIILCSLILSVAWMFISLDWSRNHSLHQPTCGLQVQVWVSHGIHIHIPMYLWANLHRLPVPMPFTRWRKRV